MSPRVQPKRRLEQFDPALAARVNRTLAGRVTVTERSPYGEGSEHSWVLDQARQTSNIRDLQAADRLARGASSERFAIGTGTLGGLVPATIPPWVAQAVAYGIHQTAPLSMALERLPLPPVGMNAAWAKLTTGASVTSQSSQNTAATASADIVAASTTDALQTIAAFADFSAQSQERSGGWFDRIIGEELGRAYGARLEQQIWAGAGSGGEITGFTVMSGNSSSTVAGQTLANQTAKIAAQFQAVTDNLGAVPDCIAMGQRRYAGLQSLTAALGMPVENVIPAPLRANLVVSPAAPTNLGGGTEDWILILNRASTPLVCNPEPTVEFQQQGPSIGGSVLTWRWLIHSYVTLGVSRRPEGVGLVKGTTAPAY
jgi:hypothetical protein